MLPQSNSGSQYKQTSGETDEISKDGYSYRLRVVFQPYWAENPYQKLLSENLIKLGVQIGEANSRNKALMGQTPDILHLHWLDALFQFRVKSTLLSLLRLVKFLTKLFILKLRGVKIVWTAHNLKNHEKLYPLLDRICTSVVANLAHAIVAHSETAKREIVSTIRSINKDKIFVIPHGNYINSYENKIDRLEAQQALDIPNSSFVFLFLGQIRPYKGVLELIEAFKQLHHKHIYLVIAGKILNDELAEQIRQKIASHSNIKFIPGFVPDDQIQVYMNACDVLVFPYQDLLTSGAAILAMSFGKACLAPSKPYFTEVLGNSGAFFYDPDNLAGLSQAMNTAVHSKNELISMGDRNLQMAEQWNWSRVAKMTLDVYKYCLSR